ncbi:MAG: phosphatase PAP2 family protein [Rickettsiaceae bacterium]|nr:phosphatase PAP2 family protein [Rickettsiaceae bacterium]
MPKQLPKFGAENLIKYYLYDFCGYNSELFHSLNSLFSGHLTQKFLKFFTLFFEIENFAIYYIAALSFIWFKFLKKQKSKEQFFDIYNYMVNIGLIYALTGIVYTLLKFGVGMKRPYCNESANSFTTIIDTESQRCFNSFPSSHTAISILCVYALWPFMNLWQKWLSLIAVLVVCASRVALAMHYPSDIIYSIAIIFILISICKKIFNLLKPSIVRYIGEFLYKNFFS